MLEIRNLKKSFRQPNGETVDILDVPTYEVAENQQAVLIGPSGGGKTTLLHIIAGITTPDSGEVLLHGKNLFKFSESGRDRVRSTRIGYVFQTFNLLPAFSALENVELGMSFSGSRRDPKRAKKLLERVGLSHRMKHKPSAMSVGEQQRVAVARALANRPKLLLADEPTANVDPANQQTIVDLILEFCKEEKISLVMVTHSMEVANQFDRVDELAKINRIMQVATK